MKRRDLFKAAAAATLGVCLPAVDKREVAETTIAGTWISFPMNYDIDLEKGEDVTRWVSVKMGEAIAGEQDRQVLWRAGWRRRCRNF